jgi:hypothetical protein
MDWKWLLAGMLIAAAVFGAIALSQGHNEKPAVSTEISAVVNNRTIYAADVSREVARMAVIGTAISREDALYALITKAVIVEEAGKQGIVVKGNETQRAFEDYIASKNYTRTQFEGMLQKSNLTIDYFMSALNQELTVKKLVEAQVPGRFIIKYDDVLQLYNGRYNNTNVSFDDVEKNLTDELTVIKQKEYKQAYISGLLSKAEIFTLS